MKKLIFTTALLTSFAASNAWSDCVDTGAVSNITAGCTSEIELVVSDLVIVKNLDNIGLGSYAGSDLSGNDSFCVGTNDTLGLTATFNSQNTSGTDFRLVGGTNGDFIPYNLRFTDGTTPIATVTSGTGIPTTNVQDLACGSDDANIQVDVTTTNIDIVSADTYTDTITVTVSPN